MSKELVISAASHERRVAILEEGQLVEIYIEREKEFALVGSIYKGKVTRVLPGMQSAFVDIGLDGDAFLYVSDVFENLEDYDHGHPMEQTQAAPLLAHAEADTAVEILPGESLARTSERPVEIPHEEIHPEEPAAEGGGPREDALAAGPEQPIAAAEGSHEEAHAEAGEERQPDSNASAPQNFAPHYNPTQNYAPRGERSGQDFGRSGDRGGDSGRGRGSRWGRRGGRRSGSGGVRRPGPGGRNLPPSKYASPQGGESRGGESRGYDNRGQQSRGFENRRSEGPRQGGPSTPFASTEEPIVLPGESLAKYRGKPLAASAPPVTEHDSREAQTGPEESTTRAAGIAPTGLPGSPNLSRRTSGGLPRWVLADAGSEAPSAAAPVEEAPSTPQEEVHEAVEAVRSDADLSEDQVAALASDLAQAKHEETQEQAEADAVVGGAEFEEESEEEAEEAEEILSAEPSELTDEETEDVEEQHEAERAEAEADAAHDSAEHAAAMGGHAESSHGETQTFDAEKEHAEAIESAAGETAAEAVAAAEEVVLLPGETRAPHAGGSSEPREDFPRDSARIGGNPRSRFQRPFRGGRDRGRDNRGGRGGRPDRGGRPRFERGRPSGPRQDRGYQGGHSGPSRRPQLISEMLKAGQDIVIQIAKEPLGKKGARITSHVALPGRFLVYMPTVDHIGVSRKIASADNRSRLRRLVGEARGSYPGGFIVRTAAGGATDDEIRTDIEFLGKTWNEIKQKSEERKAPALLHRDLDLVERMLRDYVSDDFTAIWIDSEEEYGKVVEFVSRFQPKLVNKVKLYTKETPIFEEFGIQHELDKALRAKVWLKSGGYIVINHTEALVAIDVNTGKFVGKGSTRLEDTIVKTNLEAVKEIVRQIRLRDLGGIIVVDFIDMEERRNRDKVLFALQQALEQDKAPSKALSFNEFGLVCITRKRTKQALERVLCQPCPYCTGSGMVKSIPTLCYEIQAEARKMATADHEGPNLTLRVHPEIAKALKTRESMLIDELEQNSHKHVIIQSDATLHWEQYDIY
ncbi:MAG TPA: Rne/Rng family ribonuclease [Candidatus Acidoferrum sp.]|jgi:ribonuclease G|nr:Rne/Rng family ribonuclease [Candidatus Acidoferrum sp.]